MQDSSVNSFSFSESDSFSFISQFEKKVFQGFIDCLIIDSNQSLEKIQNKITVALAVSGGADSIALLTAVHALFSGIFKIHVITVNHNIRPANESSGDALFVVDYCRKLDIPCTLFELSPGEVSKTAQSRCFGEEEAARFLRYKCFESFINDYNVDFLCMAHNLNDKTETILQRFFQGAGSSSLAGIPQIRGKFCRPLLNIYRAEIEKYLTLQNVSWRTDNTNNDNSYLRNKIRNQLIPVLHQVIPGWEKAISSYAEKAMLDDTFLSSIVNDVNLDVVYDENNDVSCVSVPFDVFFSKPRCVQVRLLYKALENFHLQKRIPYALLDQFCVSKKNVSIASLFFAIQDNFVVIKSVRNYRKTACFFAIIEEGATIEFSFANVTFTKENICGKFYFNAKCDCGNYLEKLPCPCIIRSAMPYDEVETANGGMKTLKKLFSDWKVPLQIRKSIPVIEDSFGKIKVVWGSVVNFPDWYVN